MTRCDFFPVHFVNFERVDFASEHAERDFDSGRGWMRRNKSIQSIQRETLGDCSKQGGKTCSFRERHSQIGASSGTLIALAV